MRIFNQKSKILFLLEYINKRIKIGTKKLDNKINRIKLKKVEIYCCKKKIMKKKKQIF
jgi:hypothetical protein